MRQRTDMRGYQNRVADHLYESYETFAVLKMGAGKTVSSLTAVVDLIADRQIRHALVIAPKRVATSVWPDEIKLWAHTNHLKYAVLDGTAQHRGLILSTASNRQITIIGIDNTQWLVDQIARLPDGHPIWDCLIIDETSKFKDPKSKRAKSLATIAGRFKSRWGLTGTPTPNSLLDLFTPAKIISNGRLWGKSFYKWQSQHFYPVDRNAYQWKVLPGHDAGLMADIASMSITLAEGDMPDLPPISVLVDEVVLPDVARHYYRTMESKLFASLDTTDIVAASRAVATGKLAQIANGFVYDEGGASNVQWLHDAKKDWLESMLDQLDGEPALVVYEYKEDLEMIRRVAGRDICYLGAGVSDKAADEAIREWNAGSLSVFAIHPASGGHGLNLQSGGSRMLWLAPTWSAELWDQMLARLHRPGQAEHVMVHVCSAAGTVDDLKRLRVLEKLSKQQAFEKYLSLSAAA